MNRLQSLPTTQDYIVTLGGDNRVDPGQVIDRMWNFYLSYSEAGFRAGYIDVSQLTLARR